MGGGGGTPTGGGGGVPMGGGGGIPTGGGGAPAPSTVVGPDGVTALLSMTPLLQATQVKNTARQVDRARRPVLVGELSAGLLATVEVSDAGVPLLWWDGQTGLLSGDANSQWCASALNPHTRTVVTAYVNGGVNAVTLDTIRTDGGVGTLTWSLPTATCPLSMTQVVGMDGGPALIRAWADMGTLSLSRSDSIGTGAPISSPGSASSATLYVSEGVVDEAERSWFAVIEDVQASRNVRLLTIPLNATNTDVFPSFPTSIASSRVQLSVASSGPEHRAHVAWLDGRTLMLGSALVSGSGMAREEELGWRFGDDLELVDLASNATTANVVVRLVDSRSYVLIHEHADGGWSVRGLDGGAGTRPEVAYLKRSFAVANRCPAPDAGCTFGMNPVMIYGAKPGSDAGW